MEKFKVEFMPVNTKLMVVDLAYQRECDFARVKRIIKNFNPNLVNSIKLSFRGGKYYIFDGQHTMQVQKQMNNNKDLVIENCKVYYGMTQKEEAELFALQNGESRKPLKRQELLARYVSGDVDVVALKECVESTGLKCDFKSGKCQCFSTLDKIYRKHGDIHLMNVLTILMDVWGEKSDTFRNELVDGMSKFIDKYDGEYNVNLFKGKLRKKDPLELIRLGDGNRAAGKYRYAAAFLAIYNHGNAKNVLPYRF